MEYSKLLSIRIRQLCFDHHITINKLAYMSGLKQSTVDNIIRGASKNPKIKTLHKIAISFNMTLSEFLDFPELNEFQPEEDDVD
jgi:transcriptional regulator with XRE-family HTH domain